MDPELLARGLVLGFTIAAAVGPISLLCIRRTLAEGRVVGLVSGLGVATADATYGAIAAFGLTAITDLLVDWRQPLAVVGGLFLLWIAWRTIRTVPGEAADDRATTGAAWPGAYLSTLGLTLTNPMTILSFAALFVGPRCHGRRRGWRDAPDPRRVPRLRGLVGRPGHGGRRPALAADAGLVAAHQRRLGHPHRRVRVGRPLDRGGRMTGSRPEDERGRRGA